MGANKNKNAGNSWELEVVRDLKQMGYTAGSSRNESKKLDALKVDIVTDYPFYIQCKAQIATPDLQVNLEDVKLKDKPFVVFWKKRTKAKVNFKTQGKYAILKLEDFYKLVGDKENGVNQDN